MTTLDSLPAGAILMTERQIAQALGIGERTLRRWVSCKRFPAPVQITEQGWRSKKRWLRSEVDAWVARLAQERSA